MDQIDTAAFPSYTAAQVSSFVDVCPYLVRAEGERRQAAAAKKMERLAKAMAKAKAEMAEGELILRAAFAEIERNHRAMDAA